MTSRRLQLLFGILGLLPCLACLDSPSAGERTSGGGCPMDEVCSTTTPGLFFVGTFDEGDHGPRHIGSIVVGGTENVTLFAGADRDTATPFTTPVTVVSDTPAVLAVERASGGSIVLRGVSSGTALLRVLESDGTSLIDRVTVNVIDFAPAALVGTPFDALVFDDSAIALHHYTGPLAMLRGQRLDAHITIDGGITDCGVDTALRVTDALGHVVVDGSAGAPYALTLDASSASALTFHVRTAGTSNDIVVPVVNAIDDVRIELHAHRHLLDDQRTAFVCAVGTAGGAPVVGSSAPVFTEDGDAELAPVNGLCTAIRLASGSRATVTASVDGHLASLDLTGPL